jgi:hypothetical protein
VTEDPVAQLKAVQREGWSLFAPVAVFTAIPAAELVRFGSRLRDLHFDRGTMLFPALSPQHSRRWMETTVAPVRKLVATLPPEEVERFRRERDGVGSAYLVDNAARQDFLLTRATKLRDGAYVPVDERPGSTFSTSRSWPEAAAAGASTSRSR